MIQAGPFYHLLGFIEADDIGMGPSGAQNLRAVSRAAAYIDDGSGVLQGNPRNEVDGGPSSFMLELQILLRVPFAHFDLPIIRPDIHDTRKHSYYISIARTLAAAKEESL